MLTVMLTGPDSEGTCIFSTVFLIRSAMTIASDGIDRLHTTATSHHRIIVCVIMDHKVDWLPPGAGIVGGADVILIPEILHNLQYAANHLIERRHHGKRFTIVAVKGTECGPVPLEEQDGHKKIVSRDHPWIEAARLVDSRMGDE